MLTPQQAGHSLGITIEGDKILCSFIRLEKGGPFIERFSTHEWDPNTIDVKPLYIDENTPFSELESRWLVVSGLPTQDVLVRSLELKLKKEKDIASVLSFQAEPHLPFPVSEALLDFQPIKISDKGTQITLIATQRQQRRSRARRLGYRML